MKEQRMQNYEKTEKPMPFTELFRYADMVEPFPDIPETPQKGVWYRIPLPGCVCGNGTPYYACIKIGTENNIIVNFHGGGVSWNAYTAARPIAKDNPCMEGLYFNEIGALTDEATRHGLGSSKEQNIFRNWTMVSINYSSGDFHTGCSEYPYTALDGKEAMLYYHGYYNFQEAIKVAKNYVSAPEKMMIVGGSGGGFGVAALAGDVIEAFSDCTDVTCCVDSSMLLMENWRQIAEEIWHAPERITKNLYSRNFTLDCLKALYKQYGKKIRYLYISSVRDGELARFQNFMDGKEMVYSKSIGENYQKNLKEMCVELQKEIPGCGILVFDHLPYPGINSEFALTQHTVILSDAMWEDMPEGISVAKWLMNAVNGKIEKIGLDKIM